MMQEEHAESGQGGQQSPPNKSLTAIEVDLGDIGYKHDEKLTDPAKFRQSVELVADTSVYLNRPANDKKDEKELDRSSSSEFIKADKVIGKPPLKSGGTKNLD